MKKLVLSALVVGLLSGGAIYAQSGTSANPKANKEASSQKPATKKTEAKKTEKKDMKKPASKKTAAPASNKK